MGVRAKPHARTVHPARLVGTLIGYLLLLLAVAIVVFPFIVMAFDSLKSNTEFYANVWIWPKVPKIENYRYAWFDVGVLRFMLNSLIVATGSMALTVSLGA